MLRVKGWASKQHYSDRRPPWIKLHRELLQNFKWHKLTSDSKALAICIWIVACEHEDPKSGLVTDDPEELSFRAQMDAKIVMECLKQLIRFDFIEPVEEAQLSLLAPCYQDATTETETEAEAETDSAKGADVMKPKNEKNKKSKKSLKPNDISDKLWNDFEELMRAKKAPITETSLKKIATEAESIGWDLEKAISEMCGSGWGRFKAKWIDVEDRGVIKSDKVSLKGFPEWKKKLAERIGAAQVKQWFGDVERRGNQIIVETGFKQSYIKNNFGDALRAILGDIDVVVEKKKKKA